MVEMDEQTYWRLREEIRDLLARVRAALGNLPNVTADPVMTIGEQLERTASGLQDALDTIEDTLDNWPRGDTAHPCPACGGPSFEVFLGLRECTKCGEDFAQEEA